MTRAVLGAESADELIGIADKYQTQNATIALDAIRRAAARQKTATDRFHEVYARVASSVAL